MVRVNELLHEYRMLEADYIFNGTHVQVGALGHLMQCPPLFDDDVM
jgi:hypothetical protein